MGECAFVDSWLFIILKQPTLLEAVAFDESVQPDRTSVARLPAFVALQRHADDFFDEAFIPNATEVGGVC
jgi:hypothetical protein